MWNIFFHKIISQVTGSSEALSKLVILIFKVHVTLFLNIFCRSKGYSDILLFNICVSSVHSNTYMLKVFLFGTYN
jgi:hypothetical protein